MESTAFSKSIKFRSSRPPCREWAPKCTQLDSRCFGHSVAVRRQSALNVFTLVSLGQCLAVAFGGGVWRLSDAVPRPDKGSCEWAREHTTRATPQVYLNKLRNVGADFVVVCCCRRDRGELVGDASIEPLNHEVRPLYPPIGLYIACTSYRYVDVFDNVSETQTPSCSRCPSPFLVSIIF